MADKVLFRNPGESPLVDDEVRQRWRRGSAPKQRTERFTLVQSERGDIHQRRDSSRIRSQRSYDLAAIRVAYDDRWPSPAAKNLPQARYVVGQARLTKLRRTHRV